MDKPKPNVRKILDLDDCLKYATEQKILTEWACQRLIEYYQGDGETYWDFHRGDIEDENGMTSEQAKYFMKFYKEFEDCETTDGEFKYITFDCTVYS